ncbi:hypothetical protein [Aerosakkonema funiforme]|uniref:Uncharacterized protein n=1 Tax=Aerosakkonema funiforme FACHB-1375 TaxID=2949571 RepID=A0A926ZG88_9CYAN|nr:hypothetical protein [Aerosakkonema funiforme]MBD2181928.1 hypothetical protein [Aerosakkonema funiforme FACHB-1375]
MSVFDQSNQQVCSQYNAAGNINFGSAQSQVDVISEMQKIQDEVRKAVQSGALDEEIAIDVESNLKKATIQAQKPEPDKKTIQEYLDRAKKLLAGIASAAGLVTALSEAAKAVGMLF